MPSPVEDRPRYTELIVSSSSPKKLIVAGPGTGKTFTFRQALTAAGGRGLALTFINNLVRDLETELAEVANAYTFHGFCKYLLHRTRVDGLTTRFCYYPPIMFLIAQDMDYLGWSGIDEREIDRCLHYLDDSTGVLSEALRIGSYYDTVGHTDSVYRMLRHLENHRGEIPAFPLVVVDEYQDFSLLETRFIGLLTERSPVLIAGDDDQALYGFKHASASHIRALAHDAEYSKFELPYCSRCTEVIVNAVHDVLAQAHARDLLPGRLDKPYCCYLPDKREDSERHPRIIYAYCTVERGNAPYIGRYVSARIAEIPEEEIRASQEGGYPTVLVTGPVEFVRRVHPVLVDRYPNAVLKGSSPTEIAILDGYRYLSRDAESRLGWRIVLYRDPCTDTAEVIRTALGTGEDLANLIPDDYRGRHLQIATLVDKVIRGEGLTDEEKATLVTATGLTFESIRRALHRTEDEDPETAALHQPEESALEPSIICTSLRGAKGLSASRVFIVGLNNGHFPRNPAAITDDEVCSLLVGLSRTRRQCYLVSCVRFGNFRLRPSIFLDWIRDRLVGERVDRNWIQAHTI